MRSHHLDRRAPRKAMFRVASRLCGLHAQVMSSAELTLWARVEGMKPDDVRNALWIDRTLIKTWMVRGTLHLLPASDFPLWQAALSTYDHYRKPYWLKNFGVTHEQIDRMIAAIAEALDGTMLTRNEIAGRVGEITGSAELGEKLQESWGVLLKPATYLGHVCFAPSRGQNVRFIRPDSWLANYTRIDPEEALRETTQRYFALNGPATTGDFAHFCGLKPAQAKKRVAALGDALAPVELDGSTAYVLSDHLRGVSSAEPTQIVRLVPAFDQYVISASRHAAKLLPGTIARSVIYRPQGWLSPVLLVNGRMEGLWSYEKSPKALSVSIQPFRRLPKWARAQAEEEANRLSEYFGVPLRFAIMNVHA